METILLEDLLNLIEKVRERSNDIRISDGLLKEGYNVALDNLLSELNPENKE